MLVWVLWEVGAKTRLNVQGKCIGEEVSEELGEAGTVVRPQCEPGIEGRRTERKSTETYTRSLGSP